MKLSMANIEVDESFNCRGHLIKLDVMDLVQSIRADGLLQPVLVMSTPQGPKPYKLIAGYRRFTACHELGWTEIEASVRDDLDLRRATIINFRENLDRKDLNILQEATAIDRLLQLSYTQDMIAQELGRSRSWVQVRCNLLQLPPEIQQVAADGKLNSAQIKQIYSMETIEEQFAAVKKIKDALLRGESASSIMVKKPKANFNHKRQRRKDEILWLNNALMDNFGFSFATRCLAWAAGEITTNELIDDLKKKAAEEGKEFRIPEEESEEKDEQNDEINFRQAAV